MWAGMAIGCSAASSELSKYSVGVTFKAAAGLRAAARRAAATHAAQTARAKPTPRPAPPGLQVTGIPSGVKAKGGVLANAATGGLLWSRGLDTERPIGSVAKVMTALVVIQAGNLDLQIRVPKAVIPDVDKYAGASADLQPGDILTVQQLPDAMLVPSGSGPAQ